METGNIVGGIGGRVNRLRGALRIGSCGKFGAMIGRSHTTIGNWENGSQPVPAAGIDKMVEVFNVNREWLTDDIGEMFPNRDVHNNVFGHARGVGLVSGHMSKEGALLPVRATFDNGGGRVTVAISQLVKAYQCRMRYMAGMGPMAYSFQEALWRQRRDTET